MTTYRTYLLALFIPLLCVDAWAGDAAPVALADALTKRTPIPTAHTDQVIEGWNVRVDERLLKGDSAEIGKQALKLLNAKLVSICAILPEKQLAGLRTVRIQMDLDYAGLRPMQYHPSAGWLKSKGYSESLAKCVHIPEVAGFLSPYENRRMPFVILHELTHAYHDQILDFDEPRILAAWKKFKDSGKYTSVVTSMGGKREHYGLTDQKEFFAEMTETYLGSNDFYPFVAGELKQAEPEIYALMVEIWGDVPDRAKEAKEAKEKAGIK